MNLLNLIENTTAGYDNLRALMQAVQTSQDAVLNVGGEPITLEYPEARFMLGKYKSYNKAGRQEEFIADLGNPVRFDLHMKQLRDLIAKQKNFRGSVPGERGVTGDVAPGQLEEIALQDPENMTPGTHGKLNWENMLRAYMDNRPYAEFEFGKSATPLTLYRNQIYAILKAFGNMKPQQKVNIILTVFGDKIATVDYLDKLRQKGKIPKVAPFYKRPDAEPVPPQQMALPGMPAPRIKEAQAQKKNSETAPLGRATAVNPRVARALQLARARQSAASSDIEAFVQDELEKAQAAQSQIDKLEIVNQEQDEKLQTLAAVVKQQNQQINQLQQAPAPISVAKPVSTVPQAVPAEPPRADKQPKPVEKPVEPAKEPEQQPVPQPVPQQRPRAKTPVKKRTAKKKTEPASADNVLQFPQGGRRKPEPSDDAVAAAAQGLDDLATGTFGLREETQELNIGDPVIVSGNVEFKGKTGDITGFGKDKHFVIVDLYNFGKHAFHASNVKYNDYADRQADLDEMQTKLDRYSVNQPPAGGTNKQREAFLDARDRLFRQMNGASPGEREAIRLKIAELEGRAQAQGIKIREAGEFNRAGYNAIRDVSDWEEKMRVMRVLQKDPKLAGDPEAQAAIKQRIGDLLKVGMQQGYVKEALSDKAMAVLRGLKSQPQATQPTQLDPAKQAEVDAWAQDFQRNVAGPMGRQVVPPQPQIDLNVPDEPARRRGRPSNAQRAQEREQYATIKRQIAQLDELIRMKEQIDKLFLKAQNVRGGIYPGLQADIEAEELYPVPQNDREYQDLLAKYTKDLDALQKFLAMKKAVYREDQDRVSESTALVRLKQARQALSQQDVAEGHADQQRKVFKKNGKPVGEVGIDRESSPGVGQWYMKCYAYDIDNSGYDSYEEAVAELKHCLKQGVSEGICSECGGPSFSDLILAEKQDACYHKVKSRYKVWPSAYASGALVQCRKKGAANWGNGGKKK